MGPCPRCHTALQSQTARPPGRDADVTVDVCASCQGLWLDGAELALTSEVLAALPKRLPGILASARQQPPGPACPRCSAALIELSLIGVPVDLCGDCCGVWLDGGEYQRLTAEPRPAAEKPVVTTVLCRTCQAPTALADTFYTDEGLVCGPCNEGVTPEDMRARAIASGATAAYQAFANRFAEARGPSPEAEVKSLRREVDDLHRRVRQGR